jgi:hypothetical protein
VLCGKSADHDDTGQALTQFICVLVTPPITHRPDRTGSVCRPKLAGVVGSKLARSWCLSLVNFEFFEVELCGPECSIVQRSVV